LRFCVYFFVTTDAKILSALRANPGGVSGAELAEQLGISRAAVWSRIEELRKVGFDIEAGPHSGYRIVGEPDALLADDLLARLAGTLAPPRVIGRDIRVFEETTSTNDVIEKLARDGVKEGVVVFAESQTKGRGRLGRKWISPERKGLWFSVLLRPDLRPQETTQLTVASATALRRAIQSETGLKPEIKWPNDLLIGGRKVAGILTELSAELDRVKHVILGIGVDVNLSAAELPTELKKTATSLKIESGRTISRAALAAAALRELDANYARICAGKFTEVADEWEQNCTTIGKDVTVQIGDRKIRGRAESLDDAGALLLRTEHGRLEAITGGDVTLET
jgi:BirA family transcriptional regulator, biotin operon repressor / biotin---[acetyl-CoA-carboxylase] ligase